MTVEDLMDLLTTAEAASKPVQIAVWVNGGWVTLPIADVIEDRHRDCIVIQAEK